MIEQHYDHEYGNVHVCPDCGSIVEHPDPRIIHPCMCDAVMLGLV